MKLRSAARRVIRPHNHPGSFQHRPQSLRQLLSLALAVLVLATGACEPYIIQTAVQPTPTDPPAPTSAPAPTSTTGSPTEQVSQVSVGRTLYFPMVSNGWGPPLVGSDWAYAGANPQRTSWTDQETSQELGLVWYRPIEAYISQNTQIIAAGGLLYVSTARGLYALNAANGGVAWRFDTELPLGNSPAVDHGIVYVGGYDHKLHALDAQTGSHLWAFDGAQAGYDTNPLVVEGKVIAGNRDGALYAVGAHGTPQQGQLIWKFQSGGPIRLSAAYKDGMVFFAASDNRAYALRVDNGNLLWKSDVLPGDGFQSYWPVIYQDKVIFSGAVGYRHNLSFGTQTILDGQGNGYDTYDRLQRDDLFFDRTGTTLGNVFPSLESWSHGNEVMDASRLAEYLEVGPSDIHLHKPWRRVLIILNIYDGKEYTFDSDQDGSPEYAPVAWWGARSGNLYPPLVGPDGILYLNNIYSSGDSQWSIPQGKVMGWNIGTPYFSLIGGQGAMDEPQAISGSGSTIYRNICCDRLGDYTNILTGEDRTLWLYAQLEKRAPGYDEMWWGIDPASDYPGLEGNYGTKNGIYQNHGDQNPLVPYGGMLFTHRRNAILAFGPEGDLGKLPLLSVNAAQSPISTPSLEALKGRLEAEIQKMIAAGLLRPGYMNGGQFSQYRNLNDYFDNPGDTLGTLARAYPYLPSTLRGQAGAYLKTVFQNYFVTDMYARIGWSEGAAREALPLPPEVAAAVAESKASIYPTGSWSWRYPPHNFYALWKYAQLFPEDASKAYELAKGQLDEIIQNIPALDRLTKYPYEHNAYIAGLMGYLNLQSIGGKGDTYRRGEVQSKLDELLAQRASNFSKDTPWIQSNELPSTGEDYHRRSLNISRNFMFLVPELGSYLNSNAAALPKVQEALAEYNTAAPYWFVSRYNAVVDEGAIQNLYDYWAIFQARAYALKEPRDQLVKYLDAPAFIRGDLFYIQNLIAAIEAGPH